MTRNDATTVDYTYDSIGEVKVAAGSSSTDNRGYAYDAGWNMIRKTNSAGTTTTYTINSLNQQNTSITSYDANGNTTADNSGGRTFTWDDENQLTEVTSGQTYKVGFVYDGLGRRSKRIEYGWNGSSWGINGEVRYIYDGRRVIQERDSSINIQVSCQRS